MCKFCIYHFAFQLTLLENVVDMLRDACAISIEELAHLLLGQPDRLAIRLHFKPDIVFCFVHDSLPVRGSIDFLVLHHSPRGLSGSQVYWKRFPSKQPACRRLSSRG